MTLPESFTDLSGAEMPAAPLNPALLRLREALDGILAIAGEQHGEQRRNGGRVYVFRGELQIAAEGAYDEITGRFAPLGYSAMVKYEGDETAIYAIEGDVPQRTFRSAWWVHLSLLIITLITTTVMGAALTGMPPDVTWSALRHWDTTLLRLVVRDGAPFSLTLLTILGIHEMGHYVAARMHNVKVTLPYFIPLPVNNSLGTLGAVIFIKSPFMNRRALFDVGIAGPLAGLVVALPLYVIGLQQQATVGRPQTWIQMGIERVSNPPLLEWLAKLVTETENLDRFVFYGHPMALAAWFGILLTALNLLPLGQFDGGHVIYALLGRRAWPLALMTFFVLLSLGLFGAWFGWMFWAVMGLLTGLRHPPPHDDITPLGYTRTVLGLATTVIFLLIIVPVPFYAP